MTAATETMQTAQEIEMQIAQTRASLDARLRELERRLSPRESYARMRSRLSPEPYLGWIAASAVAAGAALAVRGWRRAHRRNGFAGTNDPIAAEMMGE